jgi:hypothetical protein
VFLFIIFFSCDGAFLSDFVNYRENKMRAASRFAWLDL